MDLSSTYAPAGCGNGVKGSKERFTEEVSGSQSPIGIRDNRALQEIPPSHVRAYYPPSAPVLKLRNVQRMWSWAILLANDHTFPTGSCAHRTCLPACL